MSQADVQLHVEDDERQRSGVVGWVELPGPGQSPTWDRHFMSLDPKAGAEMQLNGFLGYVGALIDLQLR